jgi:hypothetical protein
MKSSGLRLLTTKEAWQITCHEAGHAVAAVRLKVRFFYVERGTSEQGKVEFGVAPIENPNRKRSEEEISRWQQFYAAGAAAERLLFGHYREYASSSDQRNHAKFEKQYRIGRLNGWDQDIQSVMNVLDCGAIEIVAKELDQQRKLTEEQVYELLGCVPP